MQRQIFLMKTVFLLGCFGYFRASDSAVVSQSLFEEYSLDYAQVDQEKTLSEQTFQVSLDDCMSYQEQQVVSEVVLKEPIEVPHTILFPPRMQIIEPTQPIQPIQPQPRSCCLCRCLGSMAICLAYMGDRLDNCLGVVIDWCCENPHSEFNAR